MTRPWRPSNSTDGEMWMSENCYSCVNDIFDDCEILLNLLMGYDEHVTARDGELFGDCSEYVEIP